MICSRRAASWYTRFSSSGIAFHTRAACLLSSTWSPFPSAFCAAVNAERKTKNALRGRRMWDGSRRWLGVFALRSRFGGAAGGVVMGTKGSDAYVALGYEGDGLGASVSGVQYAWGSGDA